MLCVPAKMFTGSCLITWCVGCWLYFYFHAIYLYWLDYYVRIDGIYGPVYSGIYGPIGIRSLRKDGNCCQAQMALSE